MTCGPWTLIILQPVPVRIDEQLGDEPWVQGLCVVGVVEATQRWGILPRGRNEPIGIANPVAQHGELGRSLVDCLRREQRCDFLKLSRQPIVDISGLTGSLD